MTVTMARTHRTRWTGEERAREDRAHAIRLRRDKEKTPEERLEKTVRVSRLIAELRQGVADDVPGR
jgi:hypothetical protein